MSVAVFLALVPGPGVRAGDFPIVDAHSQFDHEIEPGQIIEWMDRAGVTRTILAARGKASAAELATLARRHPDRITAAVRTKGRAFTQNAPGYYTSLKSQLAMPEFRAMAEVILWHAKKGDAAPQSVVSIQSEQARAALIAAVEHRWPFIAHYEFAAAGEARSRLIDEFELILDRYPNHPFLLIHMGQLPAGEVRRLIRSHANIHFMVSHSNPVTTSRSRQPWINLFAGNRLATEWRTLIVAHPDRFVLNFDNVFAWHWSDGYLRQVRLWREALDDLPVDVAHAVAHGNAERLWQLPPSRALSPRR